jgi:hypothetical protein
MTKVVCCTGAAVITVALVADAYGSGVWVTEATMRVPGQWQVTMDFESSLKGFAHDPITKIYPNDTDDPVDVDFFGLAFLADAWTYRLSYSPLDGPGAVVAENAFPQLPDMHMDSWLGSHGFDERNPYETPLAVADINMNGLLDSDDQSLFGLLDPEAFIPFADASNFPLDSIWTTDPQGRVWDGLTFYTDAMHTDPFAGQILIVGIAKEFPAPAVLGLIVLGALAPTRRRTIAAD